MKRIQMPSSYAVVPDGEKALLGGGGAFRDAWTSFTDHLRFTDFFFRGGLLSLSISFIDAVFVAAGSHVREGKVEGCRRPSDLQERYERSACRRKVSARLIFPEIKNALRRWILTMPQGILFVFYMTRTAPCSRSESR